MPHSPKTPRPPRVAKPAWIEAVMAALLAGVAGWVDAVGFLHFGGLFLSFMSGNTTRLGVSVAQGNLGVAFLPALVIGCFVLGALAGTLLDRAGRSYGGVLVLVVVMAGLLGALALLRGDPGEAPVVALLAAMMGMQNTAMQGVGGHAVGLTYLTGNLTKLGQNLARRIMGEPVGAKCLLFAGMWCALISGAIGGAATYDRAGMAALWPVVWLLGVIAALRAGYIWYRLKQSPY
ncbi:YoaK family protein [Roseovarius dicentrarchi]|uniref:YoaK family protein n=1 Tax=Roseovarius dicentrarchi TaxID=2250573 RepID=UPI000DEAC0C3|nr:YoaK family protein [Roseovarius dicentrarchi]